MISIKIVFILIVILSSIHASPAFTSEQGVIMMNGVRIRIKGITWFGFEYLAFPEGLLVADYHQIIDVMANNKINAVRFPFSVSIVLANAITSGNFACTSTANCNSDLTGLRTLQVMSKIIDYLATKGILVVFALYSFRTRTCSFWYDNCANVYGQSDLIGCWSTLARYFSNKWNILGLDLANEPINANWGSGGSLDWQLGAQRVANAFINNFSLNWLFFIEGVGGNQISPGSNLMNVRNYSVNLLKPNRVVYSPHLTPPSAYQFSYYTDPSYPANMAAIWDQHFGYIKNLNGPAVALGLWPISDVAQDNPWANAIADYLVSKDMTDNFYASVYKGGCFGLLRENSILEDTNTITLMTRMNPNPTDILSMKVNCTSGQIQISQFECANCSVLSCADCSGNSSACLSCLPSLFIYSDGSFCELCAYATSYSQCSQASCGSYIFSNGRCIGSCLNISNVNTSLQISPINGLCTCNIGYISSYIKQSYQCVYCGDSSINQGQCLSSQCLGYFWSILFDVGGLCTSCLLIGASPGPNGTCTCLPDQFWDPVTQYCYTCGTAPNSLCGIGFCSNYYSAWQTCLPCGANSINKINSSDPTTCVCIQGYVWLNFQCIICNTTQGQFIYNSSCYNCPIINSILNGTIPKSNNSGCFCDKNYQFLNINSNWLCSCNNSLGLFDLGNSIGCGTCSNITGAISFNQITQSCNCNYRLIWDYKLQKCKCPNSGTYFKFGIICIQCTQIITNLAIDPNSPTSCLCINGTVWNSTFSQCICKSMNGSNPNQYYNGSTCVTCGFGTLGIIDSYNRCLCPTNTVWNLNTFSCVCATGYILVNQTCVTCTSIPNAQYANSATSCQCISGWNWNPTNKNCECLATNCSCAAALHTAFNPTTKTCQPCTSFDVNANPIWVAGQCACKGAFIWQISSSPGSIYSCLCPFYSSNYPTISINKNCILCDYKIGALASGNVTLQKCNCFPNYIWSSITLQCLFGSANATKSNILFLNGVNNTCNNILKNISLAAIDNFNCLCVNNNSIFNDITGTCMVCPLGRINPITCKCPSGTDWNIFHMACSTIYPPLGQYQSVSYTRCTQVTGVLYNSLSYSDYGDIFLSGTSAFINLASASTLYSKFSGFKCTCSNGYGWNAARKRCYPVGWNYVY